MKMVDEREGEVAPADLPRAFNRQSVWQAHRDRRGGPIANLLLAVLLFAGTYVAGIPGQRACSPRRRRARRRPPPASATAISSSRSTARPCAAGRTCAGGCCSASGGDDVAIDVERPDGARAARARCRCAALRGADWEGNFMPALGSRSRSRPAADRRGRCPTSRPRAPGLRAGDRIVAIDGEPVRSPADVAARTNAQPGARA